MKDKLLKNSIQHLAEESIPEDKDPWPEIRRRLETSEWRRKIQGESSMNKQLSSPFRLLQAICLALVLFAAGATFFTSAPGHAVAQNLLQYFVRADNDQHLIPTGLSTEVIPPTRTASPTQVMELKPANSTNEAAGALKSTSPSTSAEQKTGNGYDNISLAEAKELAGFEVRVPGSLPPGYELDQIAYNRETKEVVQIYKFHPYQSGEMFVLFQGASKLSDTVGQSASIERIQIGRFIVEYASGMWFSNTGTEEWISNAPVHTFRWREEDLYFTLQFWVNETFSPAYLTRENMLAVIEMVAGIRDTYPERVNLNNLTDIQQVEKAAGFHVLAPTLLPEGFLLDHAVYEPENQRVVLIFKPQEGSRDVSGVSLVIIEIPKAALPSSSQGDNPAYGLETVMIGQNQGALTKGTVSDGTYSIGLHWKFEDLSMTMNFSAPEWYAGRLEEKEMIKLAENMVTLQP